jgi:hypothetical protein
VIEEYESKIITNMGSCVDYVKMNEDQRSKNYKLQSFNHECCSMFQSLNPHLRSDVFQSLKIGNPNLYEIQDPHYFDHLSEKYLNSFGNERLPFSKLVED